MEISVDEQLDKAFELSRLGKTAHAEGDYDAALNYATQALTIRQEFGDKQGEGIALNNIAQVYDAKGDDITALNYLTQSLNIMQDIDDKEGECATLINIGHNHWQQGQQQQAVLTWLEVYKIAKQINLAPALQILEKLAKYLGGEGLDFWEN